MSRMLTAACVAALACAAGLAWVGHDLLTLPGRTNGLAASIVGGDDARRFDDALRLFRESAYNTTASDAGLAARARAEAALAKQRGGAHLRSQAQTLLGVLALKDALAQPKHAASIAAAAADAFRAALRADPENEQAAIDLELLLARSHGKNQGGPGRARSGGKRGQTTGRERTAGRGARSSGRTGGGY